MILSFNIFCADFLETFEEQANRLRVVLHTAFHCLRSVVILYQTLMYKMMINEIYNRSKIQNYDRSKRNLNLQIILILRFICFIMILIVASHHKPIYSKSL